MQKGCDRKDTVLPS